MTDREIKLVIGGLLHDIGKVIYRQGEDGRKHSLSGYEFLKDEVGLEEQTILNMVRYHHADALRSAQIGDDDPAYIVYIADNIASAADRRESGSEEIGFDRSMPLQTVFNILNGNQEELYYEPKTLRTEDGINYPTEVRKSFDEHFYTQVKDNLLDNLRGIAWTEAYIHSLLEVLEANLSYVPSSTAKGERCDVSLYDHLKLTAAVSGCIYAYLQEKHRDNYREALFQNASEFYGENAFLLFSADVSGIQDFIYTITSKNAMKTLRARSFYLEILMEHMIDGLLDSLQLSRANLIYSGGGHCYLLLPNTEHVKAEAAAYMERINLWLTEQFDISLYVAWGFAAGSADSLKNVPEGSYAHLFEEVGRQISSRKSHRYTAQDILELNAKEHRDYTRECKVCRRIATVDAEGVCPFCRAIESFSRNILYSEFFSVVSEETEGSLPLPDGMYLIADDRESLVRRMKEDGSFVRVYGKNSFFTGKCLSTKLWVGDYTAGQSFAEYAQDAEGIDRIGILRADVDNLGHAFVAGFENAANHNRYVTLSRTAALSRQLSLFFKLHINRILQESGYSLEGEPGKRKATICYSGGDDLFIVGAWNDIVELAIDIRRCFARFSQNTLTISAGIGVYEPKYPIAVIADEVAGLEDASKRLPGKDALTLLPDGFCHTVRDADGRKLRISDGTYRWEELEREVLGEKYREIYDFFAVTEERGKAFLYHLLELIREQDDRINFARYVYTLSRLEPEEKASPEQKEAYRHFADKMYRWIQEEKSRRQLKTAITLYVYLKREKEEER